MRQVPEVSYHIIGSGRVATHLCYYFSLLGIAHKQWSRRSDPQHQLLPAFLSESTRVILAISDCAIVPFINEHPVLQDKIVMHCSGALYHEKAIGIHPLMTFSETLYERAQYLGIPFIIDHELAFETVLPGLPNPHYTIDPSVKTLYHSLCVLSGNFTCLLWQKAFSDFETQLSLPRDVLTPYVKQLLDNIITNPDAALTGPLVRNDQQTIQSNLHALNGDPYQAIYQAFVTAYSKTVTDPIE